MFHAVRYPGLFCSPAVSLERTGDFAGFVTVRPSCVFGVRGDREGVHGRSRADPGRGCASVASRASEASPAPEVEAQGHARSTDSSERRCSTGNRSVGECKRACGFWFMFLCWCLLYVRQTPAQNLRRARQGREQRKCYRDIGTQTIGIVGHSSVSSSSSTLSTPPASISGSPVRARKGVYGGFHSA